MADSHDTEQNIVEKAKEINQQVKEKQANTQANVASEINDEEPLPLNDPFVGDSSLTGGGIIATVDPQEAQNEMSLYKFKLAAVMTAGDKTGFISLINAGGDLVTLSLFEELSPRT